MSAKDFISRLREEAGRRGPATTRIGTVTEVDSAELTCTVAVEDEPDFLDVRLVATPGSKSEPFVLIPAVDSVVLISPLEGAGAVMYVTMLSNVSEVLLRGDADGGLVQVAPLVDKLNRLEDSVADIIDAISNSAVAPQDGGATYQTNMAAALAGSVPTPQTQVSDIENPNVQHG